MWTLEIDENPMPENVIVILCSYYIGQWVNGKFHTVYRSGEYLPNSDAGEMAAKFVHFLNGGDASEEDFSRISQMFNLTEDYNE